MKGNVRNRSSLYAAVLNAANIMNVFLALLVTKNFGLMKLGNLRFALEINMPREKELISFEINYFSANLYLLQLVSFLFFRFISIGNL